MVNLYCLPYHPPLTWYIYCSDFRLTVFWGYCVPLFQHAPHSSSSQSPPSPDQTTNKEEAEQVWRASYKKPSAGLSRSSNLHRAGSIKDLISKFSGSDHVISSGSPHNPFSRTGRVPKSASVEALDSPASKSSPSTPSSIGKVESPVPCITVTPPLRDTSQSEPESAQRNTKTSQITARIDCPVGGGTEKTDSKPKNKTQTTDSGRDSVADSGMGSVSKKEKPPTDRFDVLA